MTGKKEKNGKANGTNGTNGHAKQHLNGLWPPKTSWHGRPASVALPASVYAEPSNLLSVADTLRGAKLLVTGTTGFLAKVFVAQLLQFHPDIDQLYLLIRDQRTRTAERRFYEEIVASNCFDTLRQTYGDGFDGYLHEKITVLGGDITEDHLGLPEDEARALSATLDLVVNSAGLTNFNPNLESALRINTLSANHILDFIRLGGSRAKLLHVSTTFVAGRTQKASPEILPGPTVYPAYDDVQVELDALREIADCMALVEHARTLSLDQERQSIFHKAARDWLKAENMRPDDHTAFERRVKVERAAWVKRWLSNAGRERANHWGWVNIYTYTKSLGERLLVETAGDVEYAIFRPAIIESSMAYPFPGWNEGANTSAPLSYLITKGHRLIPGGATNALDVIPVDYVTGAMHAISAALMTGRHEKIYHCGSSDLNPISVGRCVELTQLGARKLIDREVATPQWKKLVLKSLDSVVVDDKTFQRQSLPALAKSARAVSGLLSKLPTKQMGGLGSALKAAQKQVDTVSRMAATGEKIFELFLPFTHDNRYTFIAQNLKNLGDSLVVSERSRYGCPIQDLDWRHYWIDVRVGLNKWVYPVLEDKLRQDPRETYTYTDLVDCSDATAANYATKVALQHHDHGIVERYTYGQFKEHAERAQSYFRSTGIGEGCSVLLASENRPQWGMAYFGMLKAGAIAVPVDAESNAKQLANIIASSRAAAIVVSERVFERLGAELEELLNQRELPTRIVLLDHLFTLALPAPEDAGVVLRTFDEPTEVASLIFTSGTTGDPKGVMLSHKNFTSLIHSLDGTFRITDRDGFLSVLPLHHTFEFAAGFLVPISKGATITYMEELSGDELRGAMNSTKISALIGVPALWQLLHRSIKQRVDASGPMAQTAFKNMVALNRNLRDRAGVNVGPVLFGAVHRAFGNHLKYMISGGASLPEDVLEAFHALGFDLYEGYGLTEAAPVLTVSRPQDGLKPGSVGKAIPDVEVEILNADENGVGEVVARGPNVMLGYLNREDETQKTVRDGWLHTGDLGKIDHKGRLTIVGRRKEVIVTSGGKNVYPDELEDVYGKAPHVLELAIVGLPDGHGSERVACLVRPDIDEDASATEIAETRKTIREWFRVEGQRVAAHNRVQVLRFFDDELPRTSTRKVKRREIVEILERLMAAEESDVDAGKSDSAWNWLEKAVATLSGFAVSKINHNTHFVDDLGFDSLMFVELSSILEARDLHVPAETLANLGTLGNLREALENSGSSQVTALVKAPKSTSERVEPYPVPEVVSSVGKKLLHDAQMRTYKGFFDVEVLGQANIPWHDPNVIVIANHSSHLDMGLVKFALGDFARDIRALAAADYFFSNRARKTYFQNFSNLIPVERAGTPDVALAGAIGALQRGEMLLMFPEGTRSTDGKLRTFRRGLGYLASTQKVNILPVWIEGTHRALPKGRPLPSPTSRKLEVRIGQTIDIFDVMARAGDKKNNELWDFVSEQAYQAIADLRDAGQPKRRVGEELTPIFEALTSKFEKDQIDQKVTYYWSLGNADDQKWTVEVTATDCRINLGKPEQADCVIKTSPEIFRRIVQEKYIPSFDEFMNGTIKTNAPELLMRFQSVFKLQG
ncbi:MAG: AMP-binding protein [bacterium]